MRIVRGDRPDPGKTELFTDTLGLRFHDVGRKALRDLGVHPLVAAVAEKVAVDLAASLGIAVLADQDRDRIGRFHRLIGDDAADGVGIGITGAVAVPDEELLLLVRSEEHTSELQSLMRISYAVFCL